jgi:hypothetical protein
MGNRDASAESFDFHFKGQKTIEAALATLVKEHGLGAKPGQTLLFGGGSAGGRGAMANLDFIDGILSEQLHVASAPRVLGFPDSPYWMDLVPDRAASPPDKFIGFAKMTADIFALGNISGKESRLFEPFLHTMHHLSRQARDKHIGKALKKRVAFLQAAPQPRAPPPTAVRTRGNAPLGSTGCPSSPPRI